MTETVSVRNLSMTYQAPVRSEGLTAALRSLARRTYREIPAVHDISFTLAQGEVTGFIGPNGAGKTTTLKMLSGILHPTGGDARVLGHQPWRRRPAFLRQIAMIRGSQPLGGPSELTVMDALRLQQLIYEVPENSFHKNLDRLAGMLELGPLLDRQMRALSLGERMRCGLAHALIYSPQVLFLDEPTIGLDVSVVELLRGFIRDYCQEYGATILLTSHYMTDIERLCDRIILINHGTIIYDGDLAALSKTISPFKEIEVRVAEEAGLEWASFGEVVRASGLGACLRVRQDDVSRTTRLILSQLDVVDLSITEPPLEYVIDRIYRGGTT
jgi:ABC-type uncharacterized transport system ATPase subunit